MNGIDRVEPKLKPVIKTIPHSRPFMGRGEIDAVSAVIASGHPAQGPVVEKLEGEWLRWTSMRSAAGVGSGLGALRLALLALGIGKGDEVILPAYSCVALLNAVLALDARPVLADVLADDWTLSPEDAERRKSGKTKAVIAVHLFGIPSDISGLAAPGFPVVEDCAHGIGGRCGDKPFGGAGTVSMSSFYATKMIAAGEGGIVAAHDPSLIERVKRARNYGDRLPEGRHLNDKMTDIEAAIACEQLNRLPEMLALRAGRAMKYDERLASLRDRGLMVLPEHRPGRIWYRYAVRLTGHGAPEVCRWMQRQGVMVEQPVWDLRGCEFWSRDLDATALAFDRVISLPLYPDLGEREQEMVCETLARCLENL